MAVLITLVKSFNRVSIDGTYERQWRYICHERTRVLRNVSPPTCAIMCNKKGNSISVCYYVTPRLAVTSRACPVHVHTFFAEILHQFFFLKLYHIFRFTFRFLRLISKAASNTISDSQYCRQNEMDEGNKCNVITHRGTH